MKKQKKFFYGLLALFFIVCLMPAVHANAKASTFKACGRENKTGKYYIWNDYSYQRLYISTSKSGNGSVLTEATKGRRIYSRSQISDGSTVYYVEEGNCDGYGNSTGYLFKIRVDGSGKKQIGVLKNASQITAYYNGYLYLSCSAKNNPLLIHTYRMNVKNGATKRVMKNACVREQKGQYLLARPNSGAIGPLDIYVYNCKTGKATRIAKNGGSANFSGSRIYYSEYVGKPYQKPADTFRIRSCTLSGTGKKTLANKISAGYTGRITSKYAYYFIYDSNSKPHYYRYNLKTKKKTAISESAYYGH